MRQITIDRSKLKRAIMFVSSGIIFIGLGAISAYYNNQTILFPVSCFAGGFGVGFLIAILITLSATRD